MIRIPNQEYYVDQYVSQSTATSGVAESWEDFEGFKEYQVDRFLAAEGEFEQAISDEELLQELGQGGAGGGESEGIELLKTLREEIQDSASSPALDGEERAQLLSRVEALSQSFLKGDLSFEPLAEKIDMLRQNFLSAVEAAGIEREGELESINGRLQTLFGEEFEKSELDGLEKRAFRDRADRIVAEVKAGKLDAQDAEGQVEALGEEVETAVTESGLLSKFEYLHSKIPAKGFAWQATVLVAEQLSAGLTNGDWTALRETLTKGGNGAQSVMQQLVGSIYFYVAGEDEKKLTAALDLLPSDIRQTMVALLLSDPKIHYDDSGLKDDADRRAHAYYATPFSTAARIRATLNDSN